MTPGPPRKHSANEKRAPMRLVGPSASLPDEQFRVLFDTMAQGVIFRDSDGKIVSANPAAERILGSSVTELLGKTSKEVHRQALRDDGAPLPPDAFPADVALRTGKPVSEFVMGVLHPAAQTYRWISVNATPIFRPGEERPWLVYILFDDITAQRSARQASQRTREHLEQEVQERTQELAGTNEELTAQIAVRKKAESALRESEEKFRRLAENADDLIFLYRFLPERRYEYVSPSSTAMTGYTPAEHYADPDLGYRLVHMDDRPRLVRDTTPAADVPRSQVLRWVRKDGGTVWVEQRNVPVTDADGHLVALQGIARDITDRITAEEKLRASERFLQTIIETEPECVKMLSENGSLMMMNRAGLDMIQAESLRQVQGRAVGPLVAPEHRRPFADLLARVFRGESGTLEFEMVGLKGRRLWMDTHSVPLRDDQDRIIAALGITRDITERKRIEAAAEERLFWFRESQRAARLGSYVLDIPTGVWSSSESLDEIFGIDAGFDRSVQGWAGLIHPDDRQDMVGYLSGVISGKKRFQKDYRIISRRDGKVRWVSGLGELVLDKSGSPHKMLGTIQDITERKLSEDALQESEKRFRQLVESVTSYIYTVTVENGRPVATLHGPGCIAVTGYAADEYTADPHLWYRMIHDEDRGLVLAQANALLSGGHPAPLEHRVRHKDGRTIWIRSTLVPRLDRSGQLIAYDGLITDITEQKRIEELNRNILETVDEAFLVIDRDYRVVSVNRAYSLQTGLDAGQLIGKSCFTVSHRTTRPCYEHGEECSVRSVFADGKPHASVHTHYDESGNALYVETKAFPLRDASGQVVAAIEIINNITDKKRLEDQLRHSQKMEAVGLLAGGISHDFNNILTAIIGYGNLLKMKLPADDPLRTFVDQILTSSARAANLTQSLLAFSRKQTINPRPMDLNEVIRRFEKLLNRLIGEDVVLRTELAPGAVTVHADSSQLEQVLMNLATNARDAMPRGGTLTVRTEIAEIGETFRRDHGFGAPGTYAAVTVQDTGTGMDKTTLDRIFDPFFTTKELGRGTGLGLAIVYGIMKQNKGYITVESAPGRGSVFRLYLPLIAAVIEPREVQVAAAPREGHETVLVAEDDEAIRNLTRTILSEYGYTVIEARDGEEAVRLFREHQDKVQLVLLDVMMPKLSGKEVRDAVVVQKPGIRTLFISGYTADVIRQKGIDETAANFILKPVSPLDLLQAVRRVLDSSDGRLASPADRPFRG